MVDNAGNHLTIDRFFNLFLLFFHSAIELSLLDLGLRSHPKQHTCIYAIPINTRYIGSSAVLGNSAPLYSKYNQFGYAA